MGAALIRIAMKTAHMHPANSNCDHIYDDMILIIPDVTSQMFTFSSTEFLR